MKRALQVKTGVAMRYTMLVIVGLLAGAGMSRGDYLAVKLDVNKDYLASIPADPNAQPMPVAPQPQPEKDPMAAPLPPRWVHAYFELKPGVSVGKDFTTGKSTDVQFPHKWGKKAVVPFELIERIKKETLPEQLEAAKKAIQREGKSGARYLDLARWCIGHALLNSFHEIMQEATLADAGNPMVAAYHKLKATLAKPPATDDAKLMGLIDDLKREGYRSMQSPAGMYTLLTNLSSTKQTLDENKRRLETLDVTYETFYYWFLLNGKGLTPQIPSHRLVVVTVASPKEFHNKHLVWGSPPLVADGFTPRGDNLAVLSATRLDDSYAILARNLRNQLQSVRIPEKDLLNGDVWDPKKGYQIDFATGYKCAFLQTMLMVQKALEEEAEQASTTHHALRQLLFVSGMLPQNVVTPEWIQYGLASSFDCPPGAVYRGVGIPSWANTALLKHFRRSKQLGNSKETLLQVVTDGQFRQATRGESNLAGTQDEVRIARAREERLLAQACSWALTYYLIKTGKLNYLQKYLDELHRMPRDLEMNERTLEGCFTRAFELTDAARLQSFADAWFAEMENTHLPIPETEQYTLRALLATN